MAKYFSLRFCGRFGVGNVLFAVPVGPEDPIIKSGGSLAKIGIDVLPNQFAFSRDLEETAKVAFADQRVAVGQSLGVGDAWAEKFILALLLVLPSDLFCRQINFDDA